MDFYIKKDNIYKLIQKFYTKNDNWSQISNLEFNNIIGANILNYNDLDISTDDSTVIVIDPETGNTISTTTTVTENQDGSTTTNITVITTDNNGNKVSSSETTTTENQDGSATSITTHYDANNNETGHETSNTDTSGNKSTQITQKDSNGNDVNTGYIIDTTANENGGLAPTQNGIDTGVIALDGHGFDIHMVFNFTFGEQGNPYKTILSAIQNTSSNKYRGFVFKNYGQYQFAAYSASTESSFNNTGTLGYMIGNYLVVPRTRQTYTLDISYRPTQGTSNGGTLTLSITPSSTGNGGTVVNTPATFTVTNQYIPNSLDNSNVIVGGCGISSYDAINMEILDFNVSKVLEG